ncbi:MAG: murein hydrolase activator EnvC family protein [Alphaproteobacteria bacterium]
MRVGVLFAALLVAASVPAFAQTDPGIGTLSERYERARRALEEQRAAAAKTEAERNRLQREAESLRARLIANANRVQVLEAELAQAGADIGRLQAQAKTLEASFARDREPVAHLLAVLQRLDRDAPPALALRPDDSLAAARGAMLLGAMLPPVYNRAADLARRLERLRATLEALEAKSKEARATAASLLQARRELAVLLERRGKEAEMAQSRLGAIRAVTEEIAREAGDLKSLLQRIARLRAQNGSRMTVVAAETADPMTLRRGQLRRPVVGRMTPGGPDAPGPVTAKGGGISGLWFAAAGGAQAVAPADGEVVFAGPYQKFGQVLILELAGGYDLVLAGLGRVDVRIGDSVLAGEPVGILPLEKQAHLYMELRRGGRTLNAARWLAGELRKAKRS